MTEKCRKVVIIPAGGSGSRMDLGYPKQLMVLDGLTVIERTIRCFKDWADEIWVAVPQSFFNAFEKVIGKKAKLVIGGATRFDSVLAAFSAIDHLEDNDLIIFHDAARPFFSNETLGQACSLAVERGAVIYASPATDTVKQVDATDRIEKTLDRTQIFLARIDFQNVADFSAHGIDVRSQLGNLCLNSHVSVP